MSLATRQQAMLRLLRGVADDLGAYRALITLLEEQFDAALRHQSGRLGEVAERIMAALDAMDARRRQRVALVEALLGAGGTMPQVFELLKGEARLRLATDWQALEQMVIECKRLNVRNSSLLTDQYSVMQRVLHGEEQIYAPG